MANDDRCPDCGVSYALVGYRHRCVAKSGGAQPERQVVKRGGAVSIVSGLASQAGVTPGPSETKTYQYRDAEKRRPYMAAYMKGYRARKNGKT